MHSFFNSNLSTHTQKEMPDIKLQASVIGRCFEAFAGTKFREIFMGR